MKKAGRRIEPHTFQRRTAIMGKQRVKKGEERIDRVERGPARAARPAHLRIRRADKVAEHA